MTGKVSFRRWRGNVSALSALLILLSPALCAAAAPPPGWTPPPAGYPMPGSQPLPPAGQAPMAAPGLSGMPQLVPAAPRLAAQPAAPVTQRQPADDADTDTAGAAEDLPGIARGDSPGCMRCHWMETMAYRDRETREIVHLSIDRDAYQVSVHHELACGDCHDRRYRHYPHRTTSAEEGLTCVGCHEERQGDEHFSPPNLDAFNRQFQNSVHVREENEHPGEAGHKPFTCFACHNPHSFRPLPNDTKVSEVVAVNNGLCLDCHTELLTPVPKGHEWLPRPQQHWSAVRCLDCHTPLQGRDLYAPSHELLGAAESNQNCVECHSKGGELLAQLYVHRAEQEREQKGFLAHAIYNDAYVIGMSRSPLIDRLGLAVVGLMVLGVAAHAYGRYLAHKRAHKQASAHQGEAR